MEIHNGITLLAAFSRFQSLTANVRSDHLRENRHRATSLAADTIARLYGSHSLADRSLQFRGFLDLPCRPGLEMTPQDKIIGVRSGDQTGQFRQALRDISRSPKWFSLHLSVISRCEEAHRLAGIT